MGAKINEREKDIQELCNDVLNMSVQSTGDYGLGAQCPLCHKQCRWDAEKLSEIEHEPYCSVLIAKDLITGFDQPPQ